MLAVSAVGAAPDDPLSALEVSDRPRPTATDDQTLVRLRTAALNHHDLWSLRGVALPAARLPMILGCDGAGVDAAGNEVVIHAVIGDPDAGGGDETLDPGRSLLSEKHPGTFAEWITVPRRNVLPKPPELSWEETACLPTAYLTAYRMLFTKARLRPGDRVLVQGAGGGVATAAILLARAAGCRVYAASRDEAKRQRAVELGAHAAVPAGERLPEKVDAVLETVGEATWAHSLASLRPGGVLVVAGATSGPSPPAELSRVFFRQLDVVGSTMGTRGEFEALIRFCDQAGVRPLIDSVLGLDEAREGCRRLLAGDVVGKIVFRV